MEYCGTWGWWVVSSCIRRGGVFCHITVMFRGCCWLDISGMLGGYQLEGKKYVVFEYSVNNRYGCWLRGLRLCLSGGGC